MEQELSNVSIDTIPVGILEQQVQNKTFANKATQTDPIQFTQIKKYNFAQLIFLTFGVLISFVIYVDIQGKLNQQQQQLELKKKNCILDYERQKCFLQLPAQQKYCREIEQCMNVDWEIQRGIELSGIVAEMLNQFIEKINLRTYLLLIIPFIALSLGIAKILLK